MIKPIRTINFLDKFIIENSVIFIENNLSNLRFSSVFHKIVATTPLTTSLKLTLSTNFDKPRKYLSAKILRAKEFF